MVSRSGQALVADCISHKARWKTVRQKYILFVFFRYFEPFYPEARRLNFTWHVGRVSLESITWAESVQTTRSRNPGGLRYEVARHKRPKTPMLDLRIWYGTVMRMCSISRNPRRLIDVKASSDPPRFGTVDPRNRLQTVVSGHDKNGYRIPE
jgi:hypothetical protein